ncbi:DUF1547 domain-containing protein [Chlamydia muridarum str. Nigg]|uniref:Uncharacterized protein TC_0741 n=2 Tax=Chlamydia muridarum TaxID=83560 RepID=Y741_CHLMU|nr:type III secretion system actin-recruiting effector Tarp [Chlamydia muridarum]Q9PJT6.1 RecName: Full=Uncharacterized protein TC_0741; Flags: Precursor [Chlamydia muridarum str. Nigg]UFW21295.1 type III secretion system actin-recruiting effector Tarp [Chlamydia trachomatis]AAF39550.1 conserved hypothetical protein [Chlamydia muridarum str. Nigg]AHH23127.1 hypothetical protein TAC_03900 [Chlamydia muridarum str. Nigg3 CMUT3-5]AHH24052.1 hypothetical protein Y015_03900 [Chlamydia muridarum str
MTTPISNSPSSIPTVTVSTTTASSGSLGTSTVSSTTTSTSVAQTATTTSSASTSIIQSSGENIQSTTGTPSPITSSVSTSAPSPKASATANKTSSAVSGKITSQETSEESETQATTSDGEVSSNYDDVDTPTNSSDSTVDSDYQDVETQYKTISNNGENTYETIGSHGEKNTHVQESHASGTGNPINNQQEAIRQLRSSTYTTSPRNENIFSPGPEGLPNMSLPSYSPTDKSSLLAFLSNPNTKAKMLEHSGHLVFIDTTRSSFIFVPNGNWDQVCSMKVQNGKTKEDLGLKDLEDMCAKFCTGYNKFSSDWGNRVDPLVSSKAGIESGGHLPSSVIINNKFRTCVAYGPWNPKENGPNYTPSAWRRGHRVDFGKIFDGTAPFNKINWGSSPTPGDDGISFSNETIGSEPFATPPSSPSQTPVINVNVNVGGTNVNIGDTNVSKGSGTPTSSQSVDMSTDTSDLDTSDIDTNNQTNGDINTNDNSNNVDGSLSDVDSRVEDDDGVSDTESTNGNDSGKTTSTEENGDPSGPDILAAVRKHLDTVYPGENGGSTEGPLPANQNLGNVIHDVEQNGSAKETIITPGDTGPTDSSSSVDADADVEDTSDTDSGIGDDDGVSDTESTNGNNSGKTTSTEENGDPSGPDILAAVRKHLDTVYPGENGGSTEGPLPANQNLGNVIHDVEQNGAAQETIITPGDTESTDTSSSVNANADLEDVSDADSGFGDDDGISDTESTNGNDSGKNTPVGDGGTPSGPDILAAVRKHLDTVYPGENGGSTERPLPANQNLGDIIHDVEQNGSAKETVVSPYRGGGGNTSSPIGLASLLPATPSTPLMTTPRTNGKAAASSLMIKGGETQAKLVKNGGNIPGETTLAELLPRLRGHLDKVFTSDGKFTNLNGPQLGAIIDQFRKETGSGGIIAHTDSVPGENGTASPLTGSSGEKVSLYDAAKNVTQALTSVTNKVTLAMQGQKLEGIINNNNTPSSIGQNLFAAARATTQSLSSLIGTVQ